MEHQPKEVEYHTLLGLAHYRAGDWVAALKALDAAMQLRPGDVACGGFFTAMAKWQLGRTHEASEWYAKSIEWVINNDPFDEDLHDDAAEASELLGVPNPFARQSFVSPAAPV